MTIRSAILTGAFLAGLALSASPAQAQVFQTGDGTPLPVPVGTAEYNLVTMSWGWNRAQLIYKDPMTGADQNPPKHFSDYYPNFEDGDAITLGGLFKWRGELIDPVADAKTAPGYFSPQCGFTGSLVLLGGNCQVAFGWYNVTDINSTTPPTAAEIHQFIPADIPEYMNCVNQDGVSRKNDGFCPLAWDNKLPQSSLQVAGWTPTSFDSGAITTDPNYLGGYVGFVVIGSEGTQCNTNKHSMLSHNQKSSSGEPWVTTLIYQSTVDPEGFYLAFEDLAMSAEDWHKPPPGALGTNDGDFNDFVFFISGIGCSGGGQVCDTGLQGACSLGRTDCAAEGQTGVCRAIVQPGTELCDNVDNDCNGVVDDGEGLCAGGLVCDQGTCVEHCSNGEFTCYVGTTCVNDHCIETACASITCPAGQACKAGVCQNACDGAVCPGGQECQLGRCIDLCAGVTCPDKRVCERGLCVSNCSCRGCSEGLTCLSDGRCGDPACDGVTCAVGEKCMLGSCVNACEGVVCPGGAQCVNGACGDPVASGAGGTVGIGSGGIVVTGGANGSGGASNGNGGPGGVGRRVTNEPGCACRMGNHNLSGYALFALLAGAGIGLNRRRSTRRRANSARN